jgi:hypothetical protein
MDFFGSEKAVEKVRTYPVVRYNRMNEKSVGAEITSELLPFKKTMIKQLNRRGYNTLGTPFKYIIPLYYNEILAAQRDFEPINFFEFTNNPAFKLKNSDNYNGDLMDRGAMNHFVAVGQVVDDIINVFRTSKIKKEQAIYNGDNPKEVLTDDELIEANTALRIEKDLERKFMDSVSVKSGELKNFIIWVVVFAFIIYLFKG